MSTASSYVFTNTQDGEERQRLQTLEQVFDPASRRRLATTGLAASWRCLEVGAGAGSIAQWMAGEVGDGEVVGIDINPRFLNAANQPNLKVIEADVCSFSSTDPFDLIHARYVLIHIPEFHVALSNMLALLKPGGWLVLEEPDFAAARAISGEASACEAVDRVNQSILQMFANKQMDYALGARLPALLQTLDVQLQAIENEAHLCCGGAGVAMVMNLSARRLAEQYTATGKATSADVEAYCRFAEDRRTWAIYYATVGTIGRTLPR